MGVFNLKYRDTRPILEVVLHDPAPAGSAPGTLGPVHDLTGSTSWKLLIWLSNGSRLIRDMVIYGIPTNGTLRYTWVAADWGDGSGGTGEEDDPYTDGGLVAGPSLPLSPGQFEHRMEYEVISGTGRMTFPNTEYDTLRIVSDIGQG